MDDSSNQREVLPIDTDIFTKFPELPTELQCRVWELATPTKPRLISISFKWSYHWDINWEIKDIHAYNEVIGTLKSICQASRYACRRYDLYPFAVRYSPVTEEQQERISKQYLWLNLSIDTILLDCSSEPEPEDTYSMPDLEDPDFPEISDSIETLLPWHGCYTQKHIVNLAVSERVLNKFCYPDWLDRIHLLRHMSENIPSQAAHFPSPGYPAIDFKLLFRNMYRMDEFQTELYHLKSLKKFSYIIDYADHLIIKDEYKSARCRRKEADLVYAFEMIGDCMHDSNYVPPAIELLVPKDECTSSNDPFDLWIIGQPWSKCA